MSGSCGARITGQGEIQAGQRSGALLIQEHEAPIIPEGPALGQATQNQPERPPIPRPVVPHDQPLALMPEQPTVLPYIPRRMDPNQFPPLARGRRGRGRINPFANKQTGEKLEESSRFRRRGSSAQTIQSRTED
ncbi:unnamed protein product [Prunus armeniaca]